MVRFASRFLILILCIIPTALTAQETDSFLLTWTPNPEPDIAMYIIYRSTDLNPGTAIDSVSSDVHSYIDSNRTKGIRYYYRLVAKNATGDRSEYSEPVSGISIPQDADEAVHDLCRIQNKTKLANGTYGIEFTSLDNTIGFVQFGFNETDLDSMSSWDDNDYAMTHSVVLDGLLMPSTYHMRAVVYDDENNMSISAVDTLSVTGEEPAPPAAPQLAIYPVPYHPGMGSLYLNNLPQGGSVTIYNENGLEVWQQKVPSSGSITWEGINNQNSPVMSGVYYVLTKDAEGAVVDKRPIMIVH